MAERKTTAEQKPFNSDFFVPRGISLRFLKEFWTELKEGKRFPHLDLYVDASTGYTVRWDKNDPAQREGLFARCSGTSTKLKDKKVKVEITKLKEKPRTKWTANDIVNFALYPKLRQQEKADDPTG